MYRIENCKISISLFKCATNPLGKKRLIANTHLKFQEFDHYKNSILACKT